MHILIIPSWYKSKLNPNAGVFFEEQARALQKRGHQVGIIVPVFLESNARINKTYVAFDDSGIFTSYQYVKSLPIRSNKIKNAYFLFRLYHKAFKNYVRQRGSPDVIHSHVYKFGGLFGAYLKQKTKIPHVFTEHFSVWVNPESKMLPSDIRIIENVFNGSSQAIAVSHFLKEGLIKNTNKARQIEVLSNMISDLFFENNDTVEKSSKFRFITIGGLTPVKNQLLLVRVFSRFIKTYSIDVELYIVGEGPLYTTIKKEIHALGLEKTVFLINALNRKDIKKEIQKSHVGVISSIVETFSIAGIEYMSQGLPVITTNCGGPNEYMRDFNGIIVHNEKEMAASFYSVYKNYSTYDADKISRYIQTCFSEAVIVQKLERTYQELVQFNKG